MKKICNKCKQEKELTEFYKNKKRKDGHSTWCKECDREYNQMYYKQNKDKRTQQVKEWTIEKKKDPKYYFKTRLGKYRVYSSINVEDLYEQFLLSKQCEYCQVQLDEYTVSFDHRIPLSRGGSKENDNIAFTCIDCNHLKHTRTKEEFLDFLENYIKRFEVKHTQNEQDNKGQV